MPTEQAKELIQALVQYAVLREDEGAKKCITCPYNLLLGAEAPNPFTSEECRELRDELKVPCGMAAIAVHEVAQRGGFDNA